MRAIYGLPLNDSQLDIFHQCTGRESYLRHGFQEATVIAGARAGKDSRIAAPIALYESIYGGHQKHLSKGERGTIPLVAQDARATRIAFGYITDYLTHSEILSSMLDGEPLAMEIPLINRMSIVCFPSTKSSLRGWSIPAGIMDELAFFRLEGSAESDAEIQTSIRRGMVQFDRTRLIKISTPYMRSGILFDDFKDYFGKDSEDVLVWKASSALMNPSLKTSRLERERRLDPERYVREYEAEFAEDLEAFLPLAWIDAAIVQGRYELPPSEHSFYSAGIDPNGGGQDAFTISIVHADGDRIVQDVCRGWKKQRGQTMNMDAVVKDIAAIMKSYGLNSGDGDRYSGQWVVDAFAKEGIAYIHSETDKSGAYLEMEPLFAQGKIEILDHPELQRELRLLERRPRPGGKVLVDHPRASHDDYPNSLALAVTKARRGRMDFEPAACGERIVSNYSWWNEFGSFSRPGQFWDS